MWLVLALCTAVPAMTVDEAVAGAVARSPAVALSAARVAEAEARVREASARLLPTVTATGAAVAQNEIEFSFADQLPPLPLLDPAAIEPTVIQPGFQVMGGVEAVQPLLAPTAWSARAAAKDGAALAEADAEAARTAVITAAVSAWHASVQAHALIDDATEALELAERLSELGDAMLEHGVASADEVLPFRRAVATAEGNLAVARAAAETADGVLQQLSGLEGAATPGALDTEVPSIDGLLSQLDRPDLEAAERRADAAESMRAVERSGWYPVVVARAGITAVEPAPDLGTSPNWRVMVGATVPLFQGGAVAARTSGASARMSQAQAAEAVARERAELEVRRAHGALARALASLAEHTEASRLAGEAVAAAERRLDGGGGSLLAVHQAMADQIAADARGTAARAEAGRARDALALAVWGRL